MSPFQQRSANGFSTFEDDWRDAAGDEMGCCRPEKATSPTSFKGFDWKTEEDAFMDGHNANAKGGKFVTYDRLRAMGNNGFQEPATSFADDKIVGTQRLYTDGVFSTDDDKARFIDAPWRGPEAEGKQEEKDKWPFLINNGRTNHDWQSAYLDRGLGSASHLMRYYESRGIDFHEPTSGVAG